MNQAEILLTVGTDFHQFDRVIQWLDRWLELNPGWQGKALCQHGASEPPVLARGVDYLDNDTLLASMRQARAVITHGGPATIFEARRQDHVPLCVPRHPALEEHVDGHQQRFARFLADEGLVRLCLTWEDFERELSRAVSLPRGESGVQEKMSAASASERLAELSYSLVRGAAPVRGWGWRRR